MCVCAYMFIGVSTYITLAVNMCERVCWVHVEAGSESVTALPSLAELIESVSDWMWALFSPTVCLAALQWPSLSQQTNFNKPTTFSVLTWLQSKSGYSASLAASAEEVSQFGSQTVGLDRQANELANAYKHVDVLSLELRLFMLL